MKPAPSQAGVTGVSGPSWSWVSMEEKETPNPEQGVLQIVLSSSQKPLGRLAFHLHK